MKLETKWRMLLLPWLRRNFPAKYPVKVRRVYTKDMAKYNGECSLPGTKFLIRINRKCTWSLVFDTTLHEWAHALTWFNETPDETDPHTAEWGVAYARLYRAFWAWNFGRKMEE